VTELELLLTMADEHGCLWLTGSLGSEITAGVFHHKHCRDLFVFCDEKHAYAHRSPTDTDLFAPEWVYWWYAANPVWTLRALLTLPAPDHPDAPRTLVPTPAGARTSPHRASGHSTAVLGQAHDQGSVR
jgi:hypothetical protein